MKKKLQKLAQVRHRPNFMAYACLAGVCIFWGTTWVVSAWTVRQGVSALQVAAVRQIIAGVVLCTSLWFVLKDKLVLPSWRDTVLLAFLNFICSNALSTWGVKFIPGGLASIVGAAYPLWLVVLYTWFFDKKISMAIWIGMLMSFFGLVLVFYPSLQGADVKGNFVFGFLLSVFSSITWALGTIYTKRQADRQVNPYFSIGLQMLLSGSVLSLVLWMGGQFTPLTEIPVGVWGGIGYLTLFGSLIAFSCFLYALKHLPAEQVSIYAYVNPIVALFISHFTMGEAITPMLLLGTAVVIVGVYSINRAFKIEV
ncbi:MAG: EamA family transporter [Saprospiraceae bacterium]